MGRTVLIELWEQNPYVFDLMAKLYDFVVKFEQELYDHIYDVFEERFQSFYKELFDCFHNAFADGHFTSLLPKSSILRLQEFTEANVRDDTDVKIMAAAAVLAIDQAYMQYSHEYFAGNRAEAAGGDGDSSRVVAKQCEKPLLWSWGAPAPRERYGRSRRALRPRRFSSRMQYFHVLPRSLQSYGEVIVRHIPTIFTNKMKLANRIRFGISQLGVEADIRTVEGTAGEVPFYISESRDDDAHFRRIEAEIRRAFKEKVHILVLPELIFPPAKERELLSMLDTLAQDSGHLMMLVLGYLHLPEGGRFVNTSKCITPDFDEDLQRLYHKVLCVEQKREPVNYDAKEDGPAAAVISKEAVKRGAKEYILTGRKFHVLECPGARMALLICKDLLLLPPDPVVDCEIDLLLVSAMTPSMKGKFESRARDYADNSQTGVIVANNGWQVDLTGKPREKHSLLSFPLIRGSDAVFAAFPRDVAAEMTLTIFELP